MSFTFKDTRLNKTYKLIYKKEKAPNWGFYL